jgi:hypothetical protein
MTALRRPSMSGIASRPMTKVPAVTVGGGEFRSA